jgi:hypothetical protein
MPRRTRSLKDTIHLSTGAGVTWMKLSSTFQIDRRRRMGLSLVVISAGCSRRTSAAIAGVAGMPHLELIFLHSESADGCNARRVLSIGSKG